MAKIRAIVGVHSNTLLVRTPYSGGVLLVRTPYLSFRGLPYSSGPHIITPHTRQDPILLRHLLARTPYYYATYSLGPHIITPSARQDPIYCVPKWNLLVRTPYFLALSARQDPICIPPARQNPICWPEAGPGIIHLFLTRTLLSITGFCGKEFHTTIGLFNFFNKCHSRQ
jgi:hypothetical protein